MKIYRNKKENIIFKKNSLVLPGGFEIWRERESKTEGANSRGALMDKNEKGGIEPAPRI